MSAFYSAWGGTSLEKSSNLPVKKIRQVVVNTDVVVEKRVDDYRAINIANERLKAGKSIFTNTSDKVVNGGK